MLLTPPRSLSARDAAPVEGVGLGHGDEASALTRALAHQPDLAGSLFALRQWLHAQGAAHVQLGWHEAGHVLPALETEPGAADPDTWQAAMEEALDQGQALCWPPNEDTPQRWVTLAQRRLAEHADGLAMSLILPATGGDPLGVLALTWPSRRGGGAPAAASAPGRAIRDAAPDMAAWQALAAEIAPILAWQRQAARPWHWHLRQALARRWRRGHGHLHAHPRRAWAAALAALLLLAAVPMPDKAGGQARIEGAQQRVLAATSDGFIKQVHAQPGDRVREGQVLADLAEQDLKLEREKWASQAAQQDNAYAAAMTRADRAEAALALSRLEEAQAQLALADEQLQRTQLRAPFDGVLIQGDLTQSIGAPVKQGDTLMTVASTGRWRVIVEIDESDITHVRIGQPGEIALSALPWDTLPLRVRRITPLGQAKEGRNVFEVEAEFTSPVPAEVRPGLTGQAKIRVGHAPLLWAALQPVIDRARLAWWSWWG